ncbi:TetR/AcrR family transcriptional regulator [Amycolatopsis alkalitolerans]|uniref:TetR/AcrR family transcriptional regulator n=1 Tax=Amycolatopsis alkalitolerans TaxID=2547244 RepID=A0A5C4M6K5_9PSEU|nr:TetR/AcrR family transcriptional regulator [Amycolatopsis alkalitolerans]TNC28483.1 TetR/AcrR family transcriptional regulator [Amycolatopsis alkalitolerans]
MGTRDDILAAAAEIMRERGYARATTKEIARAAGYSEAALYKHFTDKTEIFLGVLAERLPALNDLLGNLNPGKGTVRGNLVKLARTALEFYAESFPIAASLFSTHELLTAHRNAVAERGSGPRHPQLALGQYLRAEQRLGRLPRTADPDAMAALLLGACFQQAFLIAFEGEPPAGLDTLARSLVRPLLP